jgi:transcriptional regulator with XRE-family HTH domain
MPTPTKKTLTRIPNHTDQDLERVGATLRQLRITQGVTQDELATAIGFVRGASVAQIELGLKPLTDEKLIKAAEFLGVRPIVIRRPELEAGK